MDWSMLSQTIGHVRPSDFDCWFCIPLGAVVVHGLRLWRYRKEEFQREQSAAVRQWFSVRRRSRLFRLKSWLVMRLWGLCDSGVRRQLGRKSFWRRRWSLVLLGARYCLIFPPHRLTKIGVAAKVKGEPEITIGFEACLKPLGPFRSSTIDHELMHGVQQYFDGALDREANGTLGRKWLLYEFLACATGPLSAAGFVLVCLLPIVIRFFLEYFPPG